MKKLFILIGITFSTIVQGQNSYVISNNNLKTLVDYSGILFNDVNGYPGLKTDNDVSLIFQAYPWVLGAKNNQIKGFDPKNTSIKYGPVMNSNYYNANSGNWMRVWHVTKSEIMNHYYNYNQPGYIIPNAILEWPAHGNTSLGQAVNLASFYDRDGNGVYNPTNGDFPIIRGDECVFYIVNDGYQTTGNSLAAGLELHVMVYTYTCSAYNVLNNAVFVNYRIFNRSNSPLENIYFGMFSDFDLGNPEDDYIGTDVKHGAVYAYNSDGFDENLNGMNSFGHYPGMAAVTILGGFNQVSDGLDNPVSTNYSVVENQNGISYSALGKGYQDGIIDNERLGAKFSGTFYRADQNPNPVYYYPNSAVDIYMRLKGLWTDGTSFYYGGFGHASSPGALDNGLIPCRFLYSGNTDPANYNTYGITPLISNWTQNLALGTPTDQSSFISSGPGTIQPNEFADFDVAFVYANNIVYGNPMGAWGNLQTILQGVHQYFEMNATPCGNQMVGINLINEPEINFEIYPNPATDNITIKVSAELMNASVEIYDSFGRIVYTGRIGSMHAEFSISGLSMGYYLIKISNDKYTSLQKLSVVN